MARDFTSVGVIGLGTMGAGTWRCSPDTGRRRRRRGRRGGDRTRPDRPRQHGTGARPREDHPGGARRPRTGHLHHRPRRLADCQLVVEAVPEHLDLKKELLGKVDAVVSPDAVLATNTSSLPVTEIAVATSNPKRVVGMHFFNPAPVQCSSSRSSGRGDHGRRRLRRRQGARRAARQEAGGRRRQGGLHRQRPALRLPQPRGVDVREPLRHEEDLDVAMRFGCGYPWVRSRCSTSSVPTRPTRSSTRCTSRAATGCTPRA